MERNTKKFTFALIWAAIMLLLLSAAYLGALVLAFDEEFETLPLLGCAAVFLIFALNIAHQCIRSGVRAAKRTLLGFFGAELLLLLVLNMRYFIKKGFAALWLCLLILPAAALPAVLLGFPYYTKKYGEMQPALVGAEAADRIWIEAALAFAGLLAAAAIVVFGGGNAVWVILLLAAALARHVFLIASKIKLAPSARRPHGGSIPASEREQLQKSRRGIRKTGEKAKTKTR